jgi:hypothetical protein
LKALLEQFEHIYDVDHHYSDYNAVFVALKLEIDSMPYDPFVTLMQIIMICASAN